MSDDKASSARVAAALIRTEKRSELPHLAKMVVDGLTVFDENGVDVSDRTLYLREKDLQS